MLRFLLVAVGCLTTCSSRSLLSRSDYLAARQKALAYERLLSVGGDIQLSPKEESVNSMILAEKKRYFNDARLGEILYMPLMSFLKVQPLIAKSNIYKIIHKMPKGGVLHLHDSSMVSADWLVKNVTYRENLYACATPNNRFKFRFGVPAPTSSTECQWQLLSQIRNAAPDREQFDAMLKKKVSLLNTDLADKAGNEIWREFISCFDSVYDLIFHSPVFAEYLYRGLDEFHNDNVQYMEIRAVLKETYNLDGTLNDAESILETYQDVIAEFKRNNPTFSGVKLIIAFPRYYDKDVIAEKVSQVTRLRQRYPDLVAGFDLEVNEDRGHPLVFFLDELMAPNKDGDTVLPYYFHAGETGWSGLEVDRNPIDAILLGTRRIGHGFSVTKHPWAMEQIKARGIPIEVMPISNQVLGLVSDLRNHPAVSLIAQNYPVTISSDNPAMWGATGLSYDFYAAFMGMTGADTGLQFLKQIAINSFKYSAMTDAERESAMEVWNNQWDSFIDEMAGNVTLNNTAPPCGSSWEDAVDYFSCINVTLLLGVIFLLFLTRYAFFTINLPTQFLSDLTLK